MENQRNLNGFEIFESTINSDESLFIYLIIKMIFVGIFYVKYRSYKEI